MLIFYDPDCSHCSETMAIITADEKITNEIDSGKLKVVAVYSGEDREMWDSSADKLPAKWTIGFDDGTIQDEGMYVIRNLPAIYLIGPDGRVLVKEMSVTDNILDN